MHVQLHDKAIYKLKLELLGALKRLMDEAKIEELLTEQYTK